jgi:hypothetical protein
MFKHLMISFVVALGSAADYRPAVKTTTTSTRATRQQTVNALIAIRKTLRTTQYDTTHANDTL